MERIGLAVRVCAASMCALACSQMAFAAEARGTSQASQAAGNGEFQDIVVTAQRREERLVDVPVSVVALSGDALVQAGVNAVDDLTRAVPGMIINKTGAYLQPTIRGIGTTVTGAGGESNVAIYVDGIYVASQTGAMFDLANLASVQVLKGPQGTLFGRNATGGAILITTLDPSFKPVLKLSGSYGRFNEYKLSGYGAIGLTDTLAVDLSAYYRASDGFIRDLVTGDHRNKQSSLDIRSKLLFQPSDTVRFILSGAHNETKDPSGLDYTTANGNTTGRRTANFGPVAIDRYHVSQEVPTRIDTNTDQVALTGNIDVGFATLNSITAYRDEKDYIVADLDSSYAPSLVAEYDQFNRSFSQEVNLTAPKGDAFSWVVGLFYYWNAAGSKSFLVNNNPNLSSSYGARITSDSIAGFADATWDLGKIALIGGLRYSHEKRGFQRGRVNSPYTLGTSTTFSSWTPRVGIRYDLGARSNVYATFSRGFKSGTYNASSTSTVPVKPENVDAYEVGFKSASRLFDLNLAAYLYQYQDIQVTAFDYTVGISRLFNAARAKIYGLELEGTFRPTRNFDLRVAAAYTHARYTSFPGAPAFTPVTSYTAGGVTVPCPAMNCGNVQSNVDASGTPMVRAPDFTLSMAANYRVELNDGAELAFGIRPYWSSKINYSFQQRIQQPAYFTLDGDISYSPNEHIRLSIWGRNLTDRKYATSRSESSARDAISWAQPRTYGISANYKY